MVHSGLQKTITILCIVLLTVHVVPTQAKTVEDTLDSTQDTFISVGGTLADYDANFGSASLLTVGYGLQGFSVAMIQFDLGGIGGTIQSLELDLTMTVFGESTRTIRFDVIYGDWEELQYTGNNDPLNVTYLALRDSNLSNYTKAVTSSIDELKLPLDNHLNSTGKMTVVISGETSASTSFWIWINSRESLFYTPKLFVSSYEPGLALTTIVGLLAVLVLIVIGVVYYKKNQNKTDTIREDQVVQETSTQNTDTGIKFCTNCGNNVHGRKFCTSCGQKQLPDK